MTKGAVDVEDLPEELSLSGEIVLRARYAPDRDTTISVSPFHRGALSIMKPLYVLGTGQMLLYILNPGGGYVSGDKYAVSLTAEPGASVAMSTQSATKVYRSTGAPAFYTMDIKAMTGSVVDYAPDPLIVYEAGEYHQRSVLRVDPQAHVSMAEIITPGWSPDMSLFSYRGIRMATEVYLDIPGTPLMLADCLNIVPDQGMGIGVLDGFSHCGQLMVIDRAVGEEFLERVHQVVSKRQTALQADKSNTTQQLSVGVSIAGRSITCPDGSPAPRVLCVRTLAHTTADIAAIHHDISTLVRQEFLGLPPLRLRK